MKTQNELAEEISENDDRKEFSKAERVDYMRRLWRIEQAKAAERQRATLKQNADTDVQMFAERDKGNARDKTAAAFGVSGETMRKEMQIVENRDLLTPEDFADWDEGRLSTNKAFQTAQKPSEAVLLANVHRCTRMSMEAVQRRIGGFLGYTIFQ